MRAAAGLAGAILALALAACGGSASSTTANGPGSSAKRSATIHAVSVHTTTTPPKPPPPSYPQLLPAATGSGPTGFLPAVRWKDQTAAWVARTSDGVALMSFNQSLLTLHLHSGTVDAGTLGWRWGPAVDPSERRHLVAGFNGAFKLDTGAGGFMSYGHVAVPLRNGLASIVTYSDGTTDIGSWNQEVPAPGKHAVSVRQNLNLLIDHGNPAPTLDCITCWGATLGGISAPARSALGVTTDGRLIWAGGKNLTPTGLAQALLDAKVARAVELDINPEWVAGYFYGHRGGVGPLAPVPVMPGQQGISGQLLTPYSRDFFTLVAR